MFSERTRWDATPSPLARRVAALRALGRPLLDLTESNPTRCGFRYPEAIREAIAGSPLLTYDPDPRGPFAAREAIAAALSATEEPADPARMVLCASTSEGYGWLMKLLADPGEEILAPAPSYPLLEFLARAEGISLRSYPLIYEGRWRIDREALERSLGARTRGIVVVHPNNPTGSLLDHEEADWLNALCRERGLAIVSDEVFAPFPFDDAQSGPRTIRRSEGALAFGLGGLSKWIGLPQMKLSWILVAGGGEQEESALERLEILGDTYLPVNTPVAGAVGPLLEIGRQIEAQITARVRRNRRALREADRGGAWDCLEADGGWGSILRVPRIRSDEAWVVRLLETEGVLVHPGHLFDFAEEGYLVLSLLPRPERFDEALQRLSSRIATDVS